jgi:SAM-dependent methyltransferase
VSETPYDQPELVEFFSLNRTRPEDLYPSEAHFLPDLARSAGSVLDVGCAAGGFVDIWRAYNRTLHYTGVDLSATLVSAARVRHPDDTFLVGDAASGLDLPDGSADVVAALGWLHWEPRYEAALRELWRLTGRSLFFDVRLHDGEGEIVGRQGLPGGGTAPYVCAPWQAFADLLAALGPDSLEGYGYRGAPAGTVTGMPQEIVFASFVLGRGDARAWSLDLPLPPPRRA